jgi:hypothetical protein
MHMKEFRSSCIYIEASLGKVEMCTCLTRVEGTLSEDEKRTRSRTEERLVPEFGVKSYIPVSNKFPSLPCLSFLCKTYRDV